MTEDQRFVTTNAVRIQGIYNFLKEHPGPYIIQEFNTYSPECYYEHQVKGDIIPEYRKDVFKDPLKMAIFIFVSSYEAAHDVYTLWCDDHFEKPDYKDIKKHPEAYDFISDFNFEGRLVASDGASLCVVRICQFFSRPAEYKETDAKLLEFLKDMKTLAKQ